MSTLDPVVHRSLSGHPLRFENVPGAYPVNHYQSLLLAACAETEALSLAVDRALPLAALCATERCCGGGPAALAWKRMGVGHVTASDSDPSALAACARNAALNGVVLDGLALVDIHDPPDARFDLVACNPPCGRTGHLRGRSADLHRRTVDAGVDGVDHLLALVDTAPRSLTEHGRLLFVLPSTCAFRRIEQVLARDHAGNWRTAVHTPVAQPYLPDARDPLARELLLRRDAGEVFVWVGDDGALWRLTWVVVMRATAAPPEWLGHLGGRPVGYEPRNEDYARALWALEP